MHVSVFVRIFLQSLAHSPFLSFFHTSKYIFILNIYSIYNTVYIFQPKNTPTRAASLETISHSHKEYTK